MISRNLFPRNQISGVCGPSGVGCTRWLLKSLDDWRQGRPVLGVSVPPEPCLYIPLGMSRPRVADMLKSMSLSDVIVAYHDPFASSVSGIFRSLKSGIKLLVIEDVQRLMPSGKINEYKESAEFMDALASEAASASITVIVTIGASKHNFAGGGLHPRQRVRGSSVFASALSGFVFIDYRSSDLEADKRRLINLPSGGPRREWLLSFDSSGVPSVEPKPLKGAEQLDSWLTSRPLGVELMRKDILAAAAECGVGKRTADHWILKIRREGLIVPVARGVYIRPPPS